MRRCRQEPLGAEQGSRGKVNELVKYERDGRVAVVSLNRPEKLNALSTQLTFQLREAWLRFDADDTLAVAVFRGEGRAFCAGADLEEMSARKHRIRIPEPEALANECGTWAVSKPIVAAVHGWVAGGGTRQMLSADIVIAAKNLRFWFPELTRGLTATPVHHLLNRIRLLHLNEIVYEAEPINASTALGMALVNRIVPEDQLLAEAMRTAHRIASFPLHCLKATKRFMHEAVKLPSGAYHQGALNRALLARSADETRGAFRE
jgi:crotonobetainyl-CoA hydratase